MDRTGEYQGNASLSQRQNIHNALDGLEWNGLERIIDAYADPQYTDDNHIKDNNHSNNNNQHDNKNSTDNSDSNNSNTKSNSDIEIDYDFVQEDGGHAASNSFNNYDKNSDADNDYLQSRDYSALHNHHDIDNDVCDDPDQDQDPDSPRSCDSWERMNHQGTNNQRKNYRTEIRNIATYKCGTTNESRIPISSRLIPPSNSLTNNNNDVQLKSIITSNYSNNNPTNNNSNTLIKSVSWGGQGMNPQMHRIIIEYSDSLDKSKLTINKQDIVELPEIFSTFIELKELTILGCEIKSLKHLPPNLKYLKIYNGVLTHIDSSDIPPTIVEVAFPNNCIESFDLSETNIETITLNYNALSKRLIFPKKIVKIIARNTCLINTKCFTNLQYLLHLVLDNSSITNIDNIPDNVAYVSISGCDIYKDAVTPGIINRLPRNIRQFISKQSGITRFSFTEFPDGLNSLDLFKNHIQKLPKLPRTMHFVDISDNELTEITNIPTMCMMFDCGGNSRLEFTDEQKGDIDELLQRSETSFKHDSYCDAVSDVSSSSYVSYTSFASNESKPQGYGHESKFDNNSDMENIKNIFGSDDETESIRLKNIRRRDNHRKRRMMIHRDPPYFSRELEQYYFGSNGDHRGEEHRREDLRREDLRREDLRRDEHRRDEHRREDLRREDLRRENLRHDYPFNHHNDQNHNRGFGNFGTIHTFNNQYDRADASQQHDNQYNGND
jgi:hypothetical protein